MNIDWTAQRPLLIANRCRATNGRRSMLLAGAALALSLSTGACAEDKFPSKSLRIIVPFAAGGPGDILARTLAAQIGEQVGQSVVVENRPGGDGVTATEFAARAPADGYTILQYTTTQGVNTVLKENVRYDLMRDFVPVAYAVRIPLVMMTGGPSSSRTVADLVNSAKSKRAGLSFGSGAVGSAGHLTGELFKRAAGVKAVHVPYKGNAALLPDLATGRIDFYFGTPAETVGAIKGGLVKALAVTASTRLETMPDVPTMGEAGFKGLEAGVNYGYLLPAQTPAPVVRQLSENFLNALRAPAVQERLKTMGMSIQAGGAEELRSVIKSEVAQWGSLIKSSNIQPE